MNPLQSEQAVLHLTLQITRAATGETETVELVGTPTPESPLEPLQENDDVRHPSHCL